MLHDIEIPERVHFEHVSIDLPRITLLLIKHSIYVEIKHSSDMKFLEESNFQIAK